MRNEAYEQFSKIYLELLRLYDAITPKKKGVELKRICTGYDPEASPYNQHYNKKSYFYDSNTDETFEFIETDVVDEEVSIQYKDRAISSIPIEDIRYWGNYFISELNHNVLNYSNEFNKELMCSYFPKNDSYILPTHKQLISAKLNKEAAILSCVLSYKKIIDLICLGGYRIDNYRNTLSINEEKYRNRDNFSLVELPGSLNTDRAKKYFYKAIQDGLISEVSPGKLYNYDCSLALLACFLGVVYCYDYTVEDVANPGYKIYKKGDKPFPYEQLEKLFNVKNLSQSRNQKIDNTPPKNFNRIEEYTNSIQRIGKTK